MKTLQAQRIAPKLSFFERILTGECLHDPVQFMAGGAMHTGTIVKIYPKCIQVRGSDGRMYSLARK